MTDSARTGEGTRVSKQARGEGEDERCLRPGNLAAAIVDSLGDGVYVIDRAGRLTYINPVAERLLGWSPAELLGRRMHDVVHYLHPDGSPYPIEECPLVGVIRTGKRVEVSNEVMVRKDGGCFPVAYTATPLVVDGEVCGAVVVFRDVTEEQRATTERQRLFQESTTEREHAERLADDLRRANDTLHTLIDTIPAGVVVADARGAITLTNPAAREILGSSLTGTAYAPPPGYALRRADGSPFPSKELPLPLALDQGQATHDVEIVVRPECGAERVILAAASPIRDTAGRVTGAVAIFQDITERKRAEEALKQSEASLARAQEVARLGNWEWDLTRNKVRWSREVYRIFGLEPGQFGETYEAFLEHVHPDDRAMLDRAVREAVEKGAPFHPDHRVVQPGGTERFVHCEGSVTYDPSGRPLRMFGTIQDVTERKRTEAELDRLLARERAIAQIAKALVHEVELAEVVGVVIDQSLKVLGADVVGIWLADPIQRQLTLLDARGKTKATIELLRNLSYDAPSLTARAARTGQTQLVEDVAELSEPLPLTRQVATQQHLRSVLAVPLHSRGRLVGVVTYASSAPGHFATGDPEFNATIADLFAVAIENAQLYDEVRQALHLREEFMAAAAHELKTPVTVIKGRAQLLLTTDAEDPRVRRGLEAIGRQSERIVRLIEDLLAVIRLRPTPPVLNRARFDLAAFTREQVERTQRTTELHHFTVTTDGPLEVEADQALVGEVLSRLLENAMRYSPPGGTITVTARRQDDEAVVSVTDQGVGIPRERQQHVFEPFFEPVPPGAPGYLGLISLGLNLSRRIIEAHGGRLWLVSEPGHGSTFSFGLPLVPNSDSSSAPTPRAPGG